MDVTGVVFNIQRFSIHDGPGIRTTVFLKGCSLFCFWCHNPEGRRLNQEIQFFPDRCIGCAECVKVCEHEGHRIVEGAHLYERERCVVCGGCADGCFAGALQLTGKEMTVEQVVDEVMRDLPFYHTSGGGVTLSGGDPLMQRDFSLAILTRCQEASVHTAVETAANCRWDDLAILLPVADLIMMDLKHMDPAKHRAVTGVSNERILANAERLMATDKPVVFRTPIIPTVNDTPEEIAAIAAFVRRLQDLRAARNARDAGNGGGAPLPVLETLPFHRLAADKYHSLGLDNRASQLPLPGKEATMRLTAIARAQGIDVRAR